MKEEKLPPRRPRRKPQAKGAASHGPTLRDVAEKVGVSQATVSLILSDGAAASSFAEDTRKRVRQAAEDLGYITNPLARALRRKRSGVLGCILFNHQDIYYTRLIDIADAYAREQGFEFVVTSMDYDFGRFESCLGQMLAWRIEGLLLLFGGRSLQPALRRRIRSLNIPYVVGDSIETGQADSAALFSYRSGRLLAEHLYDLGHREFAVTGVNPANIHSSERLRGVLEWLEEAGIELASARKAGISQGLFGPNAGYDCTQALLRRNEQFTALICLNDLLALGALTALREHGIAVPEQCSVAGFDDIALDNAGTEENRLCRFTAPPLTTVRLPTQAFGREAMRRLVSQVRNEESEASYSVELTPKLVVRASTAPPSVSTE